MNNIDIFSHVTGFLPLREVVLLETVTREWQRNVLENPELVARIHVMERALTVDPATLVLLGDLDALEWLLQNRLVWCYDHYHPFSYPYRNGIIDGWDLDLPVANSPHPVNVGLLDFLVTTAVVEDALETLLLFHRYGHTLYVDFDWSDLPEDGDEEDARNLASIYYYTRGDESRVGRWLTQRGLRPPSSAIENWRRVHVSESDPQ